MPSADARLFSLRLWAHPVSERLCARIALSADERFLNCGGRRWFKGRRARPSSSRAINKVFANRLVRVRFLFDQHTLVIRCLFIKTGIECIRQLTNFSFELGSGFGCLTQY